MIVCLFVCVKHKQNRQLSVLTKDVTRRGLFTSVILRIESKISEKTGHCFKRRKSAGRK
ncbi:hypothetical protein HOLDEFILI_00052 [Holdemania filiformis DSM 12042]|uniref:Uncharacterized protein n=1 Tax=Holdemania filiformis DSM 12042 TaxID=545696 RepID=B9Y2M7_9FIRM|nr:hypothetical protein HOLDEFILI_00052 [Holdemania filiformis DSM 12042]